MVWILWVMAGILVGVPLWFFYASHMVRVTETAILIAVEDDEEATRAENLLRTTLQHYYGITPWRVPRVFEWMEFKEGHTIQLECELSGKRPQLLICVRPNASAQERWEFYCFWDSYPMGARLIGSITKVVCEKGERLDGAVVFALINLMLRSVWYRHIAMEARILTAVLTGKV